MPGKLESGERETIITFNDKDPMALIYTHDKEWQEHLEQKVGLRPVRKNGLYCREYEIEKRCILKPRPRKSVNGNGKPRHR